MSKLIKKIQEIEGKYSNLYNLIIDMYTNGGELEIYSENHEIKEDLDVEGKQVVLNYCSEDEIIYAYARIRNENVEEYDYNNLEDVEKYNAWLEIAYEYIDRRQFNEENVDEIEKWLEEMLQKTAIKLRWLDDDKYCLDMNKDKKVVVIDEKEVIPYKYNYFYNYIICKTPEGKTCNIQVES